jgi:hypothetical protein
MSNFAYNPQFFANQYNTERGRAFLAFLLQPDIRVRMQAVSAVGLPSVLAIERPLAHAALHAERSQVLPEDKPEHGLYLRMQSEAYVVPYMGNPT